MVRDDLAGPAIAEFLTEHLQDMRSVSPPESVHALDLDALRRPDVTFWTVLDASGAVAGCAALKELDPAHGEVKSMRVAPAHRGTGLATRLLEHLLTEARRRGYRRISLETGSMGFFAPARALYARHGFTACGPFGSYREDPHSVFMTREL
ncbi:GNAT family N-acetyltransferase [Kineococcus sp. NUM-3379]